MSATTTHLMTAEELFHLEDDFYHRYELLKGELLTMSPPGQRHGSVTLKLSMLLYNHVDANNLGRLYAAETGFKLESNPDTVLAPDISFIARERAGTLSDFYYLGAPDLAVEVLSPSDRKGKVERNTALWLELGAKAVWNVDPRKRTVEVIRADGHTKLFHESDELVDDTVPGFRVAVSKIFE
jgi:Uma2 family endonuclease